MFLKKMKNAQKIFCMRNNLESFLSVLIGFLHHVGEGLF